MSRFNGEQRGFTGRCGACGAHCYGAYCPAHRDIAQLEHELVPSNKKAPAAPRDKSAADATRKGA